jgi:hypothetical protein
MFVPPGRTIGLELELAAQATRGALRPADARERSIKSCIQNEMLSSSATGAGPTMERRKSAVSAPVEGEIAGTTTRMDARRSGSAIAPRRRICQSLVMYRKRAGFL